MMKQNPNYPSPLFYSLRLRSRCTKGWLAESFPFGLIACGWRQVFKIVVRRPKKKTFLTKLGNGDVTFTIYFYYISERSRYIFYMSNHY